MAGAREVMPGGPFRKAGKWCLENVHVDEQGVGEPDAGSEGGSEGHGGEAQAALLAAVLELHPGVAELGEGGGRLGARRGDPDQVDATLGGLAVDAHITAAGLGGGEGCGSHGDAESNNRMGDRK